MEGMTNDSNTENKLVKKKKKKDLVSVNSQMIGIKSIKLTQFSSALNLGRAKFQIVNPALARNLFPCNRYHIKCLTLIFFFF